MKKKKKKISLKYKVALIYIFLAIINISFFSSIILENQMQLLTENTEYKATKFIDSIENFLSSIISTYKENKILNTQLNEKIIQEISSFIDPIIIKSGSKYIIYQNQGKIYKKSAKNVNLPQSHVLDTMRVIKEKDFFGKNYFSKTSPLRNKIYFYIKLYEFNEKNNILFIEYDIKEINENVKYLYNMIAVIIGIIIIFHIFCGIIIIRLIIIPIKKLDDSSKDLARGKLDTRVSIESNDELSSLGNTFNIMAQAMQDKIFSLINENEEDKYKLLQSRMNPHYLFNALNSIYAYMNDDVETASKALIKLSKTYQFLLKYSDKSIILFDEEWSFVETYLELQQLMFNDLYNIAINKEGDFSDISIPPLTLQPLVENIFKHAFRDVDYKREITIHASREGNSIKITIMDNGNGFSKKDIFERSLGNIRKRLSYQYKNSQFIAENRTPPEKGAMIQIIFNV